VNPWLYVQSTGELYRPDGSWCATCYSGRGDGLNKPEFQNVKDEGPIPVGLYGIGNVDSEKGDLTIHLVPHPENDMQGRSGFLMHGDNHLMNHTGSEGCIVAPRLARIEVANYSNTGTLKVIARPAPQPVSI